MYEKGGEKDGEGDSGMQVLVGGDWGGIGM